MSAQKAVVLRAPSVVVASGELADGVQKYKGPEVPIEVTIGSRSGAYVGFKQLDLTVLEPTTGVHDVYFVFRNAEAVPERKERRRGTDRADRMSERPG